MSQGTSLARNNVSIIIHEASSSKTAFFSYDENLNLNKINDKPKLSLSGEKYRIDEFAARNDAIGYFQNITFNKEIKDFILNSSYSIFYWALFSTGGMRNKVTAALQEQFYSKLKNLFDSNSQICSTTGICKTIKLLKAETITGETEGSYAWSTFQTRDSVTSHAIIDLGGQTGQFVNRTHSFTHNIGKEFALSNLNNSPLYNIDSCYNDSLDYNGLECRAELISYITEKLKSPIIDPNQYSRIYLISNFYYYFNDICNIYNPYITNNNLPIDSHILDSIKNICLIEKPQKPNFTINLEDYKNISDEICKYWNNSWSNQEAKLAKDACFTGNYNYQILKDLGINDNTQLYVDFSDWAPGAAKEIQETLINSNAFDEQNQAYIHYEENNIAGYETFLDISAADYHSYLL